METKENQVYMRVDNAAKYFDVSKYTLWQWAREEPGFPKPIKMGLRVTLFDITAIEKWMRDKQ